MDLSQLRELGLTEGELKVYQALLKTGTCTKTELVKNSKVPPANIYDITNRLADKGLIAITQINNVKHFSASSPRNLIEFINKKKARLTKEESIAKQLLPTLEAIHKEKVGQGLTEVFVGWEGLKSVFLDLIAECTSKDENLVYGASAGVNDKQADIFFLKYSRLRAAKGIPLRIIFNEDMRLRKKRIEFFLNSKKCDVRFLDQKTATEVMIYRDVSVIIVLSQKPMAIRIRGQLVADSFRQHFNLMWNFAK